MVLLFVLLLWGANKPVALTQFESYVQASKHIVDTQNMKMVHATSAAEYAHHALNLIILSIQSTKDCLQIQVSDDLRHALKNWARYLLCARSPSSNNVLNQMTQEFCFKYLLRWAEALVACDETNLLLLILDDASQWAVCISFLSITYAVLIHPSLSNQLGLQSSLYSLPMPSGSSPVITRPLLYGCYAYAVMPMLCVFGL
jgi:hypothetical protein